MAGTSEAVAQSCSVKKVFSEILQNSGLRSATLFKKRLAQGVFL